MLGAMKCPAGYRYNKVSGCQPTPATLALQQQQAAYQAQQQALYNQQLQQQYIQQQQQLHLQSPYGQNQIMGGYCGDAGPWYKMINGQCVNTMQPGQTPQTWSQQYPYAYSGQTQQQPPPGFVYCSDGRLVSDPSLCPSTDGYGATSG